MFTESKNMLIHHTISHCELFPWFIFLSVRSSTLLMLSDVCALRGWPLACYQSNSLMLPMMSIFLF